MYVHCAVLNHWSPIASTNYTFVMQETQSCLHRRHNDKIQLAKRPYRFHCHRSFSSARRNPFKHCSLGARTAAPLGIYSAPMRYISYIYIYLRVTYLLCVFTPLPIVVFLFFDIYTGWLMKRFTPNFSPRVSWDNKQ